MATSTARLLHLGLDGWMGDRHAQPGARLSKDDPAAGDLPAVAEARCGRERLKPSPCAEAWAWAVHPESLALGKAACPCETVTTTTRKGWSDQPGAAAAA